MSQWTDMYRQKLTTPEEAVKVVCSGEWVDYGMATSQPILLDKALSKRKGELKDIKVRGSFSFAPREIVECDPTRETFTFMTWHMSGYDRKLYAKGLNNFIPMCYRNEPSIYRDLLDVDVAMITVAPMDKNGFFNFGLNISATEQITKKAKKVIVEVNEAMPRALGGRGEHIHISDVDAIVEAGNIPMPTIPFTTGDEIDQTIAKLVVNEIPNGATLQLGVGGLPNSVGAMIADSDLKDLGMHTEMLVDAFYLMYKKGRLTNKLKALDRDKAVWAFAVGSQDLYDWVDDNPFLAAFPVDYVNDPCVIAQIDNFISINNCIELDLFGQISSESSGTKHISGSGGQLDFADGAYRSKGGKSIIALRSTFMNKKTGKAESRIRPTLIPGTTVTDPRSQVNYVATEYGIVNLMGASTWERAERLIGIAHPDFREELIKEAEAMNIWRYSNKR
ncbi:butyryl-CoA--acetate CoA-transferase [Megasphaera vaginalis (ex Srinivasan et al. 2021)]|uniref:Probable butyrate:acetyl-CoA coenzyme A-transferase n=1 Tax=Megasphaera vaginalis (ex Srinivasan et al. 2021) TaxID=1111454 RepID=U7USP4_9FIRM|nr:butyryl-CoA--acetate CoA-transferase [Megasphaera vaginalis (ex Srinivasan et al. 2021)]ERT61488.1 butyryl-CoA:acetate CoA-transferase [Megasphaera vaginalis (ex Srinivasan et al. 2021)]